MKRREKRGSDEKTTSPSTSTSFRRTPSGASLPRNRQAPIAKGCAGAASPSGCGSVIDSVSRVGRGTRRSHCGLCLQETKFGPPPALASTHCERAVILVHLSSAIRQV